MTTRMIHPLHGAMHAYSAGEIASLQASGWMVEKSAVMTTSQELDALDAAMASAADLDVAQVDSTPEPEKRKPGRPRKGE